MKIRILEVPGDLGNLSIYELVWLICEILESKQLLEYLNGRNFSVNDCLPLEIYTNEENHLRFMRFVEGLNIKIEEIKE